jgi:hypothetical protein
LRNILPFRMSIQKKYWEKYKYHKLKRERLVELFDENDAQAKLYMEDEFVSWKDQIEGADKFLKEIRQKEISGEIPDEVVSEKAKQLKFKEIGYTIDTFNPLDPKQTI